MNGTNNSNDINVQSAADMGFGGGFGGNVNVGAAMDATDSLGGNLGLTDARGFDLGGQVAVGPSTGMPGGGQFSKAGGIVGGIMGALVGAPVQGVLAGGYGVGPVNDLFGWSSSKPELPDMGMGAATYGGSSGNA
ncbi:MAG TPA: hypothetical protein VFI48_04165, partial [Hyphomicrobiaceae bacterium]|nr:hypothetical protein [Hyphomicrobiaceae bacterium]